MGAQAEYSRRWREQNPTTKREETRLYRAGNREKVRAFHRRYENERYRTDFNYRMGRILRARLQKALRRGRAGSAVRDLGCTIPELRQHLEAQFHSGMSWENWGTVWHVDHIKPLAAFDLSDRQQFLEACHYTNLQPLNAEENRRKSGKVNGPTNCAASTG